MAFHQQVTYKVVGDSVSPAKPRAVPPEGSLPFAGVPMTRPVDEVQRAPVNWAEEKEEAKEARSSPRLKNQRSNAVLTKPEFNPYTLMDAPSSRTHVFTKLGGLGAFMIGSEEWTRKKEQMDRRQQYARQILASNQVKLQHAKPRRDTQSPLPASTRQRALDFAKHIKPPPRIEKKQFSAPLTRFTADPLDELEAEHIRLKGQVQGLKTLFV